LFDKGIFIKKFAIDGRESVEIREIVFLNILPTIDVGVKINEIYFKIIIRKGFKNMVKWFDDIDEDYGDA